MPLSLPTIALDVVRSVPDDAEIFKLCEEGNLSRVQALFSEGQASVKDFDSIGRTPLYVSLINFLPVSVRSLPSDLKKQAALGSS